MRDQGPSESGGHSDLNSKTVRLRTERINRVSSRNGGQLWARGMGPWSLFWGTQQPQKARGEGGRKKERVVSRWMETQTDEHWSPQQHRTHSPISQEALVGCNWPRKASGTSQNMEQALGWPPGGQPTVLSTRPVGESVRKHPSTELGCRGLAEKPGLGHGVTKACPVGPAEAAQGFQVN